MSGRGGEGIYLSYDFRVKSLLYPVCATEPWGERVDNLTRCDVQQIFGQVGERIPRCFLLGEASIGIYEAWPPRGRLRLHKLSLTPFSKYDVQQRLGMDFASPRSGGDATELFPCF